MVQPPSMFEGCHSPSRGSVSNLRLIMFTFISFPRIKGGQE